MLEISKRYFDPDHATNAQHVRSLFGESLRTVQDDSDEVSQKITLVDALKVKVKIWAINEIRTRMVDGLRQLGYEKRVRTWKDVRKLCIDDPSVETRAAIWNIMYGNWDTQVNWTLDMEKVFMKANQLKYLRVNNENDKIMKGCIAIQIGRTKNEHVKALNKALKKKWGVTLTITRNKEEMEQSQRFKKRKKGETLAKWMRGTADEDEANPKKLKTLLESNESDDDKKPAPRRTTMQNESDDDKKPAPRMTTMQTSSKALPKYSLEDGKPAARPSTTQAKWQGDDTSTDETPIKASRRSPRKTVSVARMDVTPTKSSRRSPRKAASAAQKDDDGRKGDNDDLFSPLNLDDISDTMWSPVTHIETGPHVDAMQARLDELLAELDRAKADKRTELVRYARENKKAMAVLKEVQEEERLEQEKKTTAEGQKIIQDWTKKKVAGNVPKKKGRPVKAKGTTAKAKGMITKGAAKEKGTTAKGTAKDKPTAKKTRKDKNHEVEEDAKKPKRVAPVVAEFMEEDNEDTNVVEATLVDNEESDEEAETIEKILSHSSSGNKCRLKIRWNDGTVEVTSADNVIKDNRYLYEEYRLKRNPSGSAWKKLHNKHKLG